MNMEIRRRFANRLILMAIMIVAIILRFYQLGSTPSSPDWDEASLGYNAYSILRTGRDEYGTFMPLSIRSFGDYKPPLYVYLTVPSAAAFGLSVWSVRLPSAAFGVLAVLGTYVLILELWQLAAASRTKSNSGWPDLAEMDGSRVALLAAFLLAVSPWHLQFSRVAFEANLGVTLNIWGAVLFLKGLKKHGYLLLSAIVFGLTLYAYHSERVFAPLLVCILAYATRRDLARIRNKRWLAAGAVVGILTVLPLLPVMFDKTTFSRLSGTSTFSNQTQLLAESAKKLEYDAAHHDRIGMILDNRRIEWVKTIAAGYLSHASPEWLFLTGDNARHHAPDMGLLYLWELPFIILGMATVARKPGKLRTILLGWTVIAPIAASPTTGVPHAVRTLVFLPTFQIFTATGLFYGWMKLGQGAGKRRNTALLLYGIVIAIFFTGNFGYYLSMYYDRMNRDYAKYWQYGYRQVVQLAESKKNGYRQVVVSENLDQPYIFFLFYTKYDPALYQAAGGTAGSGHGNDRVSFGKYVFRNIDWPHEVRNGTRLYIGTPGEIPGGTTVAYPDGTPAFRIADS